MVELGCLNHDFEQGNNSNVFFSKKVWFGLVVALAHAACTGPSSQRPPNDHSQAYANDWVSPDTLATAVYTIVSGPAGVKRDWSRYHALFRHDARLTTFDTGGRRLLELTVDDYIWLYGPTFLRLGIYEREVAEETRIVRNLAHRWSSCEYGWGDPSAPPAGRSKVSMQFVNDGERWWITNMAWELHEILPRRPW